MLTACTFPHCGIISGRDRCEKHRAPPPIVVMPPPKPALLERAVIRAPRKPKAGAGNTRGGETPRIKEDQYYTPDRLAVAICREMRHHSPVGIPLVVIEPSAGRGAFVRAARAVWGNAPSIIAVEKDRASNSKWLDQAGAELVRYESWEDAADVVPSRGYEDTILVLGNVPFGPTVDGVTLAEAHLKIALERLGHGRERTPVPRFFASVLRSSFLATKARCVRQHVGRGGLRHVWNLVERPSFTENEKTDGAEYIVGLWQAGYRGEYGGSWLSWPEES